jgi:hypothetical protein
MKRIPQVKYKSPEEIEAAIRQREAEAMSLPPGATRQSILVEVAKLRAYADVKRWVASPTSKSGA